MNHHILKPGTTIQNAVTLSEVKQRVGQSRVDDVSRDGDITAKISSATSLLESITGSVFSRRTMIGYAQEWQNMRLKMPLASITSVKYLDVTDVEQTVSSTNYYVDTLNGELVFKTGFTFPTLSQAPNCVYIEYEVGFTTTPQPLKDAIMVLVQQWEINQNSLTVGDRPMTMPWVVNELITGYRDFRVM